jgi:TDG/mug DNA glycosylase family protein
VDRATVEIYEEHAAEWEARRSPTQIAAARRFGSLRGAGVAIDLGCGPGWYTTALGSPVVALDAAHAMVRRAAEVAPGALAVQADLVALPFRRSVLAGAWARNTYVHLPTADVPMALADLHRSLSTSAPVELTLFEGEVEGRDLFQDDDFPGRWFSTWSEERLRDVIHGAGFHLEDLERHTARAGDSWFRVHMRRSDTLPDLVSGAMRLLVCGLNPSVHAATAGVGYVTPGNRFWPAAVAAGLVTRDRQPLHALRAHGIGMTDLVKRATSRADALTRDEYRAGLERLDRLCAWLRPGAVCLVGLAGWRAAADRTAQPGWQRRSLGGTPVYVMPSTSGLNAATPLSVLVEHLRAATPST